MKSDWLMDFNDYVPSTLNLEDQGRQPAQGYRNTFCISGEIPPTKVNSHGPLLLLSLNRTEGQPDGREILVSVVPNLGYQE